jgi:hypothetical protein
MNSNSKDRQAEENDALSSLIINKKITNQERVPGTDSKLAGFNWMFVFGSPHYPQRDHPFPPKAKMVD